VRCGVARCGGGAVGLLDRGRREEGVAWAEMGWPFGWVTRGWRGRVTGPRLSAHDS
jgi:hypothetical protein